MKIVKKKEGAKTYGKNHVTEIHQDEDQRPNASEMIKVTGTDEDDGDEMMGHHLPVIFSVGFGVENEDLMEPKRELSEVVDFDFDGDGDVTAGITHPTVNRIPCLCWE